MKQMLMIALLCIFNCCAKVLDITSKEQFYKTINENDAVVKFSAQWCSPCKATKKPFEELSSEKEFKQVAFLHVDTDENESIASDFNITGLPTFVYISKGKEVNRETGLTLSAEGFKKNMRMNLHKEFNIAAQEGITEPQETVMPETAQAQEAKAEPKQVGFFDGIVTSISDFFNWIKSYFTGK